MLALDRDSVRSYDADGHLHVKNANISKAAVNPYLGREIPGCETLGLDPGKIYRLLRDPGELEKATASLSGKPLLLRHTPVSANDHPHDITIGSVGTEPGYSHPYAQAPLTIWDGSAIGLVDSDEQKELSAGYRYDPDMTPGTYEGEPYDGVMRNLSFNHVAIVSNGRAGPSCVIGDELTEELIDMKKPLTRKAAAVQGGVISFLRDKLAQDAKIDITSALVGVTAKNFSEKKAGIVAAVTKLATPKLAQDADLDGLANLVDAFSDVEPTEDTEATIPPKTGLANGGVPGRDAEGGTPASKLKAVLAGKVDDETMAEVDRLLEALSKIGQEHEQTEQNTDPAVDADKPPEGKEEEKKDMVDKPAMDAAIAAAVKRERESAKDLRDAERFVRPWIGETAQAYDSAESVLRAAAKALKIEDAESVHPSALRSLIKMAPLPGAKPAREIIAQDAAGDADYLARFPNAKRLKK